MAKKSGMNMGNLGDCCKVEAVVSVDERGQMVLPKDVREKGNIKTGDKLAVVSMNCGCGGCPSCLVLIKVDQLSGMLKNVLGPAFEELKK